MVTLCTFLYSLFFSLPFKTGDEGIFKKRKLLEKNIYACVFTWVLRQYCVLTDSLVFFSCLVNLLVCEWWFEWLVVRLKKGNLMLFWALYRTSLKESNPGYKTGRERRQKKNDRGKKRKKKKGKEGEGRSSGICFPLPIFIHFSWSPLLPLRSYLYAETLGISSLWII